MTGQQAFVSIYAGLAATFALACALIWRWSQPPTVASTQLDDVELAALNGGPLLAAAVAAMTLGKRGSAASDLLSDASGGAGIRAVLAKLESMGLRLGVDARLRMRALWWTGLALALAGIAGITGILVSVSSASLDGVALATTGAIAAAIAAITRWSGRRLWTTAAGRRLLRSVCADRTGELRALSGHPTLAVAIYGSSVLWVIEAELAQVLHVPIRIRTALGDGRLAALGAGWDVGCSCG